MATDTTTSTPADEMPDVMTVSSWGSDTVHAGKQGRMAGSVVSACNGRSMSGMAGMAPADTVTCKRCRKAVTA